MRRSAPDVGLLVLLGLLHAFPFPALHAQQVSSSQGTEAEQLPLRAWGEETLQQIRRDLWLPDLGLYADAGDAEEGGSRQPAFMWGAGVQLSALTAAAHAAPERYTFPARNYADALQLYWTEHEGIGGFDVLPAPKPSDRYYDDNVWVVLALLELFELTDDRLYLERAGEAFRFVLSGEDDRLGGGIYWRENTRESKNTCSNAPSIVAALRLHQLTGESRYLQTAQRLYAWTNRWLQDPEDGLYWDNVDLAGEVDTRKYSYNTALMIRANALLLEETGDLRYLEEARRIAGSAAARWVEPQSGGIRDEGRFAHLLLESFLFLHRVDPTSGWEKIVSPALRFVHAEVRGPQGRYGKRWDREQNEPLKEFELLDQASAARAYWVAALQLPGQPR